MRYTLQLSIFVLYAPLITAQPAFLLGVDYSNQVGTSSALGPFDFASAVFSVGPHGGGYVAANTNSIFKYSPDGQLLWQATVASQPRAVAADFNANVYVLGASSLQIITPNDRSLSEVSH